MSSCADPQRIASAALSKSRLLVGVLNVPDQGLLQRGAGRKLRMLQQSGASTGPLHEELLARRRRARHRGRGPLSGIFLGRGDGGQARLRLVVSITMLRKAVAVEFDRASLTSGRPAPAG